MTKASHLIEDQLMSSAERAEIINESEWERNLNNNRDEGRKEGLQEGLKEGLEAGERRAKYASARKLLAKGNDPAEIAEIVDLPVDEIVQLSMSPEKS